MNRSVNDKVEKKGISKLLTVAALILFVASVVFFFFGNNAKQSSTTISVDEVRALANLASAEAKVTLVKENVDRKFFGNELPFLEKVPGTERNILLVIPAKVLAGVDLEKIEDRDFNIDEGKKEITLTLPHATFLQEPAVIHSEVKTYSDTGLISGGTDIKDGFDITAIAMEELKKEATDLGILEQAEENAVKALETFFSHIGYTVKVTFK